MSRAAALLLLLALPASAELKVSARLAFGDQARMGEWTAVRLEIENSGGKTELAVRIEAGDAAAVRTVQAPAGSHLVLWIPAKAARTMPCRVAAGDLVVLDVDLRPQIVPHRERFLLAVGESSLGLPARDGWTVLTAAPADLPDISDAYATFDAVVIRFPMQGLSDEAADALRRWTLSGGALVVCAGIESPTAAGSPFGRLLPVTVRGVKEVKRLTELGAGVPTPAAPFPVADVEKKADAGQAPWGGSSRAGIGRCVFLGFDPLLRPVSDWGGLAAFWQSVLPVEERAETEDEEEDELPETATPAEKKRLEARRRTAAEARERSVRQMELDRMREAAELALAGRHVSLNWFFGLLLLYLLAIGPLDYFLLKRLGRMPWTWATLPVAIVAFCGAAYSLSSRDRAREPQLAAVGIIDVWPGGARETAVYSVVAPRSGPQAIALEASEARVWPVSREDINWGWKPGLRELPEMVSGAHAGARHLNVTAWDPFGLAATVDLPERVFEIRAGSGRVTIHPPATLTGCAILEGAEMRFVGDLEPGATIPWGRSQPAPVETRDPFALAAEKFLTGFDLKPISTFFRASAPSASQPILTGWLDRSLAGPTLGGRPPERARFLVRVHLGGLR